MNLSNTSKLQILNEAVANIATIGYRLEEILDGIKLFNEHRSSLNIEIYEASNDMFIKSIAAFEEQLKNFHDLFSELKEYLE
jgi:hypothetical protein